SRRRERSRLARAQDAEDQQGDCGGHQRPTHARATESSRLCWPRCSVSDVCQVPFRFELLPYAARASFVEQTLPRERGAEFAQQVLHSLYIHDAVYPSLLDQLGPPPLTLRTPFPRGNSPIAATPRSCVCVRWSGRFRALPRQRALIASAE